MKDMVPITHTLITSGRNFTVDLVFAGAERTHPRCPLASAEGNFISTPMAF
jgi:hypothetical protein